MHTLNSKIHPNGVHPFSVRRIVTLESLLDLRERWNHLNYCSNQPSAFRTFEWTYYWWKEFLGSDLERLRLFVVEDPDGELLAVFPLHRTFNFGSREWRMIGDHRGHRVGTITEEPTILIRDDANSPALFGALDFITNDLKRDWEYYRIDIPTTRRVPRLEVKSNIACCLDRLLFRQMEDLAGSALVDLPETWEVFRAGLSRSMRDNLSYYPRRLNKAGHHWAVRFLDTPGDIRAGIPLLAELHRARSRGGNGTSPHLNHLPREEHIQFLTRTLPRFGEQREAFIAVLDVDDKPVAAQVFFMVGNVLTFYYSGFHTEWNPYSPLFIIAAEVIRRAISRDAKGINFLPNDAPWKERWGATAQGHRYRLRTTQLSLVTLLHRVATLRNQIRILNPKTTV